MSHLIVQYAYTHDAAIHGQVPNAKLTTNCFCPDSCQIFRLFQVFFQAFQRSDHLYLTLRCSSWRPTNTVSTGLVVWRVVSALASINEVNLHRAWLVLRWVTVSGFNSLPGAGHLFRYVTNQLPKANLSLPSLQGR